VDIQRSQIEGVQKMTTEMTSEDLKPVPTVRARIAFVDGVAPDFQQREVRQQQGQIGREFAVTYRPNLEENEKVIAGKWWDSVPTEETEVSVVDDMARTLKIGIGSVITFDVLGRKINAKVTSVRKIDVRNTRTVFIFVFRPGTLDSAPQTFALPVINKIPAVERARFQRKVIDAYPNVQIFDVQDILTTVTNLINNFVLAISFVGSFVMLTGILILIGSVSLTKSQRIYENAILKTLGARRGSLLTILFTEYAILGLLAGIIGAFFATILSFAVTKYILNFDWEFDWTLAVLGVLITAVLVTIIGTLASFDVLFKKPLSILRSQ
jgi:putative ABC transport system permease protein